MSVQIHVILSLSLFITFSLCVIQMRILIISIIFALLQQGNGQNPKAHWTLLPNILVLQVNGALGQHPLTCLESAEEVMRRDDKGQEIIWKKNGVEEDQRGNMYLVELEESLGGGNYTCHNKDGSLLNHTVVLIQEDKTKTRKILVKSDQEDYLICSTQNYNGEFHCSWTWHPGRVGKVAFIRVHDDESTPCSVDTSGQQWTCSSPQGDISCSVDGSRMSCRDKQHCPYAEEAQHININVYFKTNHFLVENYSKYFYLSEIVKPDKVKISKVNGTTLEWSYPSSWNSPYSYFPLTFQIAQIRRGCKKCSNSCTHSKAVTTMLVNSTGSCQVNIKPKVEIVCIRAKDALCNSHWSEWSHIRSCVRLCMKNYFFHIKT
uniref:Interleukin-12 subunit beta n=1 Tax=Myripristis murdjan TaxID=586833 RepID=A0A668A8W6_9TELE